MVFDTILRWWYTHDDTLRVAKCIAFYEDNTFDYLKWEPDHFEGLKWEDFGCARLEIRLVCGSKKRRVVLYPGTPCDPKFPPPQKQVVVNARLLPRPHVGATAVDVTKRVQKYMGNTLKSVHHMFPFDDHDDDAERFGTLRIIDLSMRVTDLAIEAPYTRE
jgi:hypothetical protein